MTSDGGSDVIPERFFMDDPDITWRYGYKPDYTLVNKKYVSERSSAHKAGSLEKLIENTVKTWEMEASHKPDIKEWGTVDPEKYEFWVNGKRYGKENAMGRGTYNVLLAECPAYQSEKQTFQSSHDLFKTCFDKGFAWELIDLFSGPPRISLTWRHWSNWTGPYGDNTPTGELIELHGAAFATVNKDNRIERLEIFYDPNPMMAKLIGNN